MNEVLEREVVTSISSDAFPTVPSESEDQLLKGIKQDLKACLLNPEDRARLYSDNFKQLESLPDSTKLELLADEELIQLGQKLVLHEIGRFVETDERHIADLHTASKMTQKLGLNREDYHLDDNEIDVVEKCVIKMANRSRNSSVNELVELAKVLRIPQEIIVKPDVQEKLPKYIDRVIWPESNSHDRDSYEKEAFYINNYFPSVNKVALVSSVLSDFAKNYDGEEDRSHTKETPIIKKIETFITHLEGVPADVIQDSLKTGVIKNLRENEYYYTQGVKEIINQFDINDEIKQDPEVLEAAYTRAKQLLKGDKYKDQHIEETTKVCDYFNLYESAKQDQNFQDALDNACKLFYVDRYKEGRYVEQWENFVRKFNITESRLQQSVRTAVEQICHQVTNDDFDSYSLEDAYERIIILIESPNVKSHDIFLEDNVQKAVQEMVIKKTRRNIESKTDFPVQTEGRNIKSHLTEIVAKFPFKQTTLRDKDMEMVAKEHFHTQTHLLKFESIENAKKIVSRFNLDNDFITSQVKNGITQNAYGLSLNYNEIVAWKNAFELSEEEFVNALSEGLKTICTTDYERNFNNLTERLNEVFEAISQSTFENSVRKAYIETFSNDPKLDVGTNLYKFIEMLKMQEFLESNEVQHVYEKSLINLLKSNQNHQALKLVSGTPDFKVSSKIIENPEVQQEAMRNFVRLIKTDLKESKSFGDSFNLSEKPVVDPEAHEILLKELINTLESTIDRLKFIDLLYGVDRFKVTDLLHEVDRFTGHYKLPEELIRDNTEITRISAILLKEIYLRQEINSDHVDDKELEEFKSKLAITNEVDRHGIVGAFDTILSKYWDGYGRKVPVSRLKGLIEKEPSLKKDFELLLITAKLFNKENISPDLFEEIGVSSSIEEFQEDDYKRASEAISRWSRDWQSEVVYASFKEGAEIFGYKSMVEFINREGLSHHDALHAFREIIELYKASGLNNNEFYGNILHQVMMDNGDYYEGTAHHHLNAIVQTMNKDVLSVLETAREYKDIDQLQELINTFKTPKTIYSSWNSLKRYSDLQQILGQTEIFEELNQLKNKSNPQLYKYVETLLFHPDSKVDMNSVRLFWKNPIEFLGANASHTPQEVHDRKKPSNYVNMPNLDLTAEELRDALVEGSMDMLQVFTPLEVRYIIPIEDFEQPPIEDVIRKALGSRKDGIQGQAKNSGKLFGELNAVLKPHGLNITQYLQGSPLPKGVNIITQIETLLYNKDFGIERPQIQAREFVAKISRKSDPEGAIAGDDTVNCMPFGDGKNTVYTFNPNTAQFVIRMVKGDGKERTIAQSVLTKDMDVKNLVPEIISKLEEDGRHLEEVLPEDILRNTQTYVAADNVEVSPNFSDQRYQEIISTVMRDYFREYMNRYSKVQGLEPTRIPVGQGYTDALSELPTAPNTYAPQAPVSYSDKTGEAVYVLDLSSDDESHLILERSVTVPETIQNIQPDLPNIPGISYLTFEDSLRVGYLEGKAYASNESLMQFLFNMENALIAKDINNSAKNRPNMSLKYTDSEGKMSGYFLSWEGLLTDEYVQNSASEYYNQSCIYMMDLAADPKSRLAGGSLIRAFTDLYKRNYLDRDNPIPIFAQARETTSFRIIQRQLERLGRETGAEFELIELPTYDVGEDTMHPVIIQPKVSLA